MVCIGSEEDYRKCKFRHTTGGNGNDNRNTCSKFPRSRRNGTDSGYFDRGRWYGGFRSGNVEPRDDDDDVYGKKYRTTSEDRTDRSAARAKQKEDREKQERERAALRYAEAQLQKEVE